MKSISIIILIVIMVHTTKSMKIRPPARRHPEWRKHSSFSNPSFNPQMISELKKIMAMDKEIISEDVSSDQLEMGVPVMIPKLSKSQFLKFINLTLQINNATVVEFRQALNLTNILVKKISSWQDYSSTFVTDVPLQIVSVTLNSVFAVGVTLKSIVNFLAGFIPQVEKAIMSFRYIGNDSSEPEVEIAASTVTFLNKQANFLVELELHVGNLIMEIKYDLDDIQKGYSAYDSSSHNQRTFWFEQCTKMYATISSTYRKISSSIRSMLDNLSDINVTWKTSYTEIINISPLVKDLVMPTLSTVELTWEIGQDASRLINHLNVLNDELTKVAPPLTMPLAAAATNSTQTTVIPIPPIPTTKPTTQNNPTTKSEQKSLSKSKGMPKLQVTLQTQTPTQVALQTPSKVTAKSHRITQNTPVTQKSVKQSTPIAIQTQIAHPINETTPTTQKSVKLLKPPVPNTILAPKSTPNIAAKTVPPSCVNCTIVMQESINFANPSPSMQMASTVPQGTMQTANIDTVLEYPAKLPASNQTSPTTTPASNPPSPVPTPPTSQNKTTSPAINSTPLTLQAQTTAPASNPPSPITNQTSNPTTPATTQPMSKVQTTSPGINLTPSTLQAQTTAPASNPPSPIATPASNLTSPKTTPASNPTSPATTPPMSQAQTTSPSPDLPSPLASTPPSAIPPSHILSALAPKSQPIPMGNASPAPQTTTTATSKVTTATTVTAPASKYTYTPTTNYGEYDNYGETTNYGENDDNYGYNDNNGNYQW